MQDLRLVGVHDDGEHLLLSGPDGDIFLLPIDEALRMATTRSPRRSTPNGSSGIRLSPREIQAQIRSGATASDVAEHSGLSLEQVRRYEGPVLAEREHVSRQARGVALGCAIPNADGFKSALGETPATLDEMVTHRLAAFGIDPATVRWDAWRLHDGSWSVTADFDPGEERAAISIGESAPARWTFHTGRRTLRNANRWAQQLSELEPIDGPLPERRLSAVADRPFDFETDSPEDLIEDLFEETVQETPLAPAETEYPGDGLLSMLRSRRGQRLGIDEDGDDELAALLGSHVPAAHPRLEEDHDEPAAASDSLEDFDAPDTPVEEEPLKPRMRSVPFLSLAPSLPVDSHTESVGEVSTDTREITISGAPSLRQTALDNGVETGALPTVTAPSVEKDALVEVSGPSDSEVAARLERKAASKPKRSSVPSWDEIVFGTKGD